MNPAKITNTQDFRRLLAGTPQPALSSFDKNLNPSVPRIVKDVIRLHPVKNGHRRQKSDTPFLLSSAKKGRFVLKGNFEEMSMGNEQLITHNFSGYDPQSATVNKQDSRRIYFTGSQDSMEFNNKQRKNNPLSLARIAKNRKLFKMLNCSTKDCELCTRKKKTDQIIRKNLEAKYMTAKETYALKVSNDIVYNEPTHIVAVFKDYLIWDDNSEFLKRYYKNNESGPRLNKAINFYSAYSKVFPNFVLLEEKKYMFKNIERKQKFIDQQQAAQNAEKDQDKESEERLFTTNVMSDLQKPYISDDSDIEHSTLMKQYVNYKENIKKPQKQDINQISLHALVDKFIIKDSQTSIEPNGALLEISSKWLGQESQKPSPEAKPIKKLHKEIEIKIDIKTQKYKQESKNIKNTMGTDKTNTNTKLESTTVTKNTSQSRNTLVQHPKDAATVHKKALVTSPGASSKNPLPISKSPKHAVLKSSVAEAEKIYRPTNLPSAKREAWTSTPKISSPDALATKSLSTRNTKLSQKEGPNVCRHYKTNSCIPLSTDNKNNTKTRNIGCIKGTLDLKKMREPTVKSRTEAASRASTGYGSRNSVSGHNSKPPLFLNNHALSNALEIQQPKTRVYDKNDQQVRHIKMASLDNNENKNLAKKFFSPRVEKPHKKSVPISDVKEILHMGEIQEIKESHFKSNYLNSLKSKVISEPKNIPNNNNNNGEKRLQIQELTYSKSAARLDKPYIKDIKMIITRKDIEEKLKLDLPVSIQKNMPKSRPESKAGFYHKNSLKI